MPTALDLTSEERQHYIAALRARMTKQSKPLTVEERLARENLLTTVRQVASQIKLRFGATRVILFGSLAHEAWFWPQSDVDLAVEGLDSTSYWEAWRLAEQIIHGRNVDMVEIESARPALKRAIERYGVEL